MIRQSTNERPHKSLLCNNRCIFCCYGRPGGILEIPEVHRSGRAASKQFQDTAVLVVGEPTMNRDLPKAVRGLVQNPDLSLSVFTNGRMLSQTGYARHLANAGARIFTVSLHGPNPEVHDAITRVPGSFNQTISGIQALESIRREFGLEIRLAFTMVQNNIGHLYAALRLAARFNPSRILFFDLYPEGFARESFSSLSIDYHTFLERAAHAIGHLVQSLQSIPPIVMFGYPRCVIETLRNLTGVAEITLSSESASYGLQYLPIVQRQKGTVCVACRMYQDCEGVSTEYLKQHGWSGLGAQHDYAKAMPTGENNVTKRKIKWLPYLAAWNRMEVYGRRPEFRLRINFNCNQQCIFCWIHEDFKNVPDRMVRKALERMLSLDPIRMTFTGGEPLLNPRLEAYVAHAADNHVPEIQIQTNAVLASRKSRVRGLADSGVNEAFVSLHSHNSRISDRITCSTGTFKKTVQGIRNFKAAGVEVVISHVVNVMNYRALREFSEFVYDEFGRIKIAFLLASPIIKGQKLGTDVIPCIDEIAPYLKEAMEHRAQNQLPFDSLDGPCGFPPCILDGDKRFFNKLYNCDADYQSAESFVHPECCMTCLLRVRCVGIRRSYYALYGDRGLKPIV